MSSTGAHTPRSHFGGQSNYSNQQQQKSTSSKEQRPRTTTYICGECNELVKIIENTWANDQMIALLFFYQFLCYSDVELRERERIACKICGFRILYKKRATHPMVFDCR